MLAKDTNNKYNILIIGAGPAGLAAAMELYEADKDFLVIEKSNKVGGLAKTYVIKEGDLEFRTDNGPHRFFSKNEYLYGFISNLLQERWITVKRQTRQFINGQYFDYPINALQVVKNLGPLFIFRSFFNYLVAWVGYSILKKPINNFYDYAVDNFGKTLALFNIINYTEKVWGVSAKELHIDWAKQRISGLNLFSLAKNTIKKLIFKSYNQTPKTLVERFFYPELGSGLIYETIKEKIEKAGYKVLLNSYPTKISHEGNRITKVRTNINNNIADIYLDYLIESIPVVEFLGLLDPLPPAEILKAASKLRYRSQVYLFVTLDKNKITDDQWIYFPDKSIPFARISEMKNFSGKMSPSDKTSLFIEFFCDENDDIYGMDKAQLFELSLPYFEKYRFFNRNDVRNVYHFRGSKDYPIYDIQYKDNLEIIGNYLDKFENLYYIGRPGRFKYTNQDHSLEMGILAAKSIVSGKKFDIENVGAKKEYFEMGYLPSKSR